MKKIILIMSLSKFAVFAQSYQPGFCSELYAEEAQLECFGMTAKFYSKKALQLCRSIEEDSDVLECLNAISDKGYSKSSILSCSSLYFDKLLISCLEKTGRKPFFL